MNKLVVICLVLVLCSGVCLAAGQSASFVKNDLKATIGVPIYCKITRADFAKAKLEALGESIAVK